MSRKGHIHAHARASAVARRLVAEWVSETGVALEKDDSDVLERKLTLAVAPVYGGIEELSASVIKQIRCPVARCGKEVSRRGLCEKHFRETLGRGGDGSWGRDLQTKPPPGDPKPMTKVLTARETLIHRRADCPAMSECLMYVVKSGWPSFSCHGCHGPVRE